MKKILVLVVVLILMFTIASPVLAATGVTPPGYGGGGADPGTGSSGDGDPPGWSNVNPGQGGTGLGK